MESQKQRTKHRILCFPKVSGGHHPFYFNTLSNTFSLKQTLYKSMSVLFFKHHFLYQLGDSPAHKPACLCRIKTLSDPPTQTHRCWMSTPDISGWVSQLTPLPPHPSQGQRLAGSSRASCPSASG